MTYAHSLPPLTVAANLAVALAWLVPEPASAQRVEDNAIADAEDAFGSADGGEDLGVYNPFDVRGFSPIDAGNVRIEGVYVDRQADLSQRLVAGNRIRVGVSAVGYAFPAPSGVIDYRLRTPGEQASVSAVVQANSWGGAMIEVDAALPLAHRLSVGFGASQSRSEYPSGNNADITNLATVVHWRPGTGDLKLFWSRTRIADEDIFPIVMGNGHSPPPRLERRRFLGQPWADLETERFNYGAIARATIAGFAIRGGVLRSVADVTEGHNVFLQAAAPGDLAARTVSAYPGRYAASTSGEIALARELTGGRLQHRIQFVARGRSQTRRYGGAQRLAITPAPFGRALFVDRPAFRFLPQSDDRVRQWSVGLTYDLAIREVGQVSGGIQKVSYRKAVTTPSGQLPQSRDRPTLFNFAGTVTITPRLSGFGSFATGLEESDVAPEIAVNRDEAPPAIPTRQLDGGARLRAGPFTLIGALFDIRRPYYGVDEVSVFRRLGDVRHRGAEFSVTGMALPGLTVVAGGALLRARLSGHEVAEGAAGERPVDVPASKLVGSLDWRAPGSPLSIDLAVERIGPNTGDTANRVRVAPYATLDIGARYRFRLGQVSMLLRAQATNLLNTYGWEIAGSNAFVYAPPRQVLVRLVADL